MKNFSRGHTNALTSPFSQKSVKTIDGEKGIIEYSASSGFTAFGGQGACIQWRQAKQADS